MVHVLQIFLFQLASAIQLFRHKCEASQASQTEKPFVTQIEN